MQHVPALTGLRGLALLLVLLYHANLLAAGWVGVQLFFVLSGYLITAVLFGLKDHSAHPLRRFFWRRVLRILPAYFAYLLLVSLLAGWPESAQRQIPYALSFTYNLYRSIEPADKSRLFDHLWSLSIEEQFYLLWPWLVLGLSRARLRWVLVLLICAGPFLRAALGVTNWGGSATRGYLVGINTLSHLDAFACGAILHCIPQILRRYAGGLALLLVVCTVVAGVLQTGLLWSPAQEFGAYLTLGLPNGLPERGHYIWGYSLINLASAACIAHLVWARPAAVLLSCRPLQAVGRVSYAAYLWHFPLAHLLSPLVFVIHEATGWGLYASLLLWLPVYLLAVLGIAAASWWAIEKPLLRYKDRCA